MILAFQIVGSQIFEFHHCAQIKSSKPDTGSPTARVRRTIVPDNRAGSSLLGMRESVLLNCGCTLAVTTNP